MDRILKSLTVSILALAGSGTAFAADIPCGTKVCQMMQLERDSIIPDISKTEKGKAAIDVVPVMSWVAPDVKYKAAILCVHGLGLHKGTYSQFAERMAKEGYAMYAVDVRGFGSFLEMPGQRRCDFPRCLEDVKNALVLVHKAHPDLPLFLLGESMGGAISLRVTADHPELLDGLISSVPAAERYGQTRSAISVGVNLLTHPKREMDISSTVVNQSTAKEELRKEWAKDPLARFNLTPVELMQFQSFMEENEKSARKITRTPVLMVQGASDHLVRHDANENIIKHIPCKDSQLIFVENAEHLIFEEGQFSENVIEIVKSWLASHGVKSDLTAGTPKLNAE